MIVRSREELRNSMIDAFEMDIPVFEGTITYAIFSAVANAIAREYVIKDEEQKSVFVRSASGDFLDKRVEEFGYSRKIGTPSEGIIRIEGLPSGIFIDLDTELVCENGMTFNIEGGITTDDTGIVESKAYSKEIGFDRNIPAGLDFQTTEFNYDRIYNPEEFKGGLDTETDDDLKARFFHTQKNKGNAGNENHYEEWAKEVVGVYNAKATGEKEGAGTVELVVSDKNNTSDEELLNSVKQHVESQKPIGSKLFVKGMNELSININAKILTEYDVELIQSNFFEEANEYLKKERDSIKYSKLYSILANSDNVTDVTEFKVNDDVKNIPITTEQIGKLKDVKIEKDLSM